MILAVVAKPSLAVGASRWPSATLRFARAIGLPLCARPTAFISFCGAGCCCFGGEGAALYGGAFYGRL